MRNRRIPPHQQALLWLFVTAVIVVFLAILYIAGGI